MASTSTKSRLTRARNVMPAAVRKALQTAGVLEAYQARPDYQQNDYLGWIARAAREETKQKRTDQMLAELQQGDVYMNMAWSPQRTRAVKKTATKRAAKKVKQ